MSQKSITNFFKPLAVNTNTSTRAKRAASPDSTTGKRLKVGDKQSTLLLSPKIAPKIDDAIADRIKSMAAKAVALHSSIGPTWFKALEQEFKKEYFAQLSKYLAEERKKGKVFPPENQVYTWTQMCPIREVKVVILGQDPYHNLGQAHGLCFSVPKGVQPPPSLLNMYKELESDIEGFKPPGHGDLTGWAKQGVLLLNACLTVRAHQANSHADKGWEKLTDAVIRWINEHMHGVVFMLWGSYAQKKGQLIDKKRHVILKSPHPSPLSAHRGFFGCKHFSQANAALKKASKMPIAWSNFDY